MRLRVVAMIAGVLLLIGGGFWLFSKGTNGGAVGTGGLPLIKADTNPAKLPPDEPGGEIMPNADSTVFSAMSNGSDIDPSMRDVKAPEKDADPVPEDTSFAGLRTGFALPKEPEKKTESLFDTPKSKYYSGGALGEQEAAAAEEPAPQAEPEVKVVEETKPVETPVAEEAPAEKVEAAAPVEDVVVKEEETAETAPVVISSEGANAAQNMEAEEMGFVRPVSKPPVPQKEAVAEEKPAPVVKPKTTEKKPEAKPEQKSEIAGKAYYIQLASAPGTGDASAVWAKLQGKYPAALNGLKPVYLPVTVAGKGEYVRIQAGPLSQDQARERCAKLRSVDTTGGCLVLRR